MSISRYVRTSIRPSVHPSTKSFSDLSEIWYVDRRRWVMHDGMPYDPIQGQGHGASEVPKIALFHSKSISSVIYSGSWQMVPLFTPFEGKCI